MQTLYAVLILGGLGAVLGSALAVASKVFYVKIDSRIEDITNMLPGYNCGACGTPGCQAFAEAIISGTTDRISNCKPGKMEDHFVPIMEYLKANLEEGAKLTVKI